MDVETWKTGKTRPPRNGFGVRRRGTPAIARPCALACILLAIIALVGCLNPFSDGSSDSKKGTAVNGDSDSQGELVLELDGGVTGSTVAPDGTQLLSNISRYYVLVHDPTGTFSDIEETDLSAAAFPYAIADLSAIDWEITVRGYNAGGALLAESETVTVSIQPGGNSVSIRLKPVQTGATGNVGYELNWPPARVSSAAVQLFSVPDFSDPLAAATPVAGFTIGEDYTIDVPGGNLTVDTVQPSGCYLLQVDMTLGGVPYPAVYESVVVYDHLDSSKSVTLTDSDFTDPPTAPTDLVIEVTGDNSFNIHWTDTASMEAAYQVTCYDGADPGNVQTIAAGLPPNSSQYVGAASPFGNIEELNVEVTALNAYGTSNPLSVAFTVLPSGPFGLPYLNTSATPRTNDPSWVALGSPGTIFSPPAVPGGGDTLDLIMSGSNNISDIFSLPAPEHTTIADSLSYSPVGFGLAAGQTYYWRTQAHLGSSRVIYPVNQFTVRDGNLYVDATGSPGAAGDINAPVPTITEAMDLAEANERINIAVGQYDEWISDEINEVPMRLYGGYATGFGSRTAAVDAGAITPGVNVTTVSFPGLAVYFGAAAANTVVIDGLHIRGETYTVEIGGAVNAEISNSVIENGAGNPGATGGNVAISVASSGIVSLIGNRIDLTPPSLSDPASVQAGGVMIEGGGDEIRVLNNLFHSSQNPDSLLAVGAAASANRVCYVQENEFQQMSLDPGSTAEATLMWSDAGAPGAGVIFERNTAFIPRGVLSSVGVSHLSADDIAVRSNEFILDGTVVNGDPTTVSLWNGAGQALVENNLYRVEDHTGAAGFVQILDRNTNIDNNTMVVNGTAPSDWYFAYGQSITARTVNVRNNLVRGFADGNGTPLWTDTGPAAGVIANNLFFNYQNFQVVTTQNSIAELEAGGPAMNNVEVNPVLDPAIFAPTMDSPIVLRGGGLELPSVGFDIDSAGRTGYGELGYTMGAFERDYEAYISSVVVPIQVLPATTGDLIVELRHDLTPQVYQAVIPLLPHLGQTFDLTIPIPDEQVTPGEPMVLAVRRSDPHNDGTDNAVYWYSTQDVDAYPWGEGEVGDDYRFAVQVRPRIGVAPVLDQSQTEGTYSYYIDNSFDRSQGFIVGAP